MFLSTRAKKDTLFANSGELNVPSESLSEIVIDSIPHNSSDIRSSQGDSINLEALIGEPSFETKADIKFGKIRYPGGNVYYGYLKNEKQHLLGMKKLRDGT